MKRNYWILGFGMLVLTASCHSSQSKNDLSNQEIIPVKIEAIQQDTLHPSFQTSGYFTTDNETPLSFKNGGIIDKIYVQEGDRIKAGELLATVHAAEVKSVANQAELAYQKALRDYQRAQNLYRDSVVTLEQMQNAKTALSVAKQRRDATDFNVRHSEILAPADGFVLNKFLNEGQMAGPGTPVFLVNSTNSHQWFFKTDVSADQWSKLSIGDSAIITTKADPGRKLYGLVEKKGQGVNPKTGGFTIQISLAPPPSIHLASGLFGQATLLASHRSTGWHIPYSALLDGDSGYGYVFITNDLKTAQKVKVHISTITHGFVSVDSGLEKARYLIVSGSAYLKAGSKIKVVK